MTPIHATYLEQASALLARIAAEEGDAIVRAGAAVADRIAEDRLIYVIGPGGHSQIGAEEVFSRAGGLACIVAFIDDGFYLGNGAGPLDAHRADARLCPGAPRRGRVRRGRHPDHRQRLRHQLGHDRQRPVRPGARA